MTDNQRDLRARAPDHSERAALERIERGLRARVTDHAVVRYLERCCGVDIDGVRATILGAVHSQVGARVKEGKIRVPEMGVRVVIKGGTVVSLYRVGEAAE